MPFEKGNKHGKGRPKLPEDLKHARTYNRKEVERLLNELIHMPPDQLADRKRAPKTMLELFVIAIITQGINKGDQQRLNFLLENIYGKVKDSIEIEASVTGTNEYSDDVKAQFVRLVKNSTFLQDPEVRKQIIDVTPLLENNKNNS